MQTITEIEEAALQIVIAKPSLLRQIIDEIDELDNDKKEELLWKIKIEKALHYSKKADNVFKDQFQTLSDIEISELVSKNRKAAYEEKIHH